MTDAFPRPYSAAPFLTYDPVAAVRQLFARMLNHKHSMEEVHLPEIQSSRAAAIMTL
jgi:hypothetical protein